MPAKTDEILIQSISFYVGFEKIFYRDIGKLPHHMKRKFACACFCICKNICYMRKHIWVSFKDVYNKKKVSERTGFLAHMKLCLRSPVPHKSNVGEGGCKLNNMEMKEGILLIQGYHQLQREFEASLE